METFQCIHRVLLIPSAQSLFNDIAKFLFRPARGGCPSMLEVNHNRPGYNSFGNFKDGSRMDVRALEHAKQAPLGMCFKILPPNCLGCFGLSSLCVVSTSSALRQLSE